MASQAIDKKVVDITQREEGEAAEWVNEPLGERCNTLLVHTLRPFNAEPPNSALQHMITPPKQHYRRTHTPVPVVDEKSYRFTVGLEDDALPVQLSMEDIRKHITRDIAVTLMCTGNRRSEFNTKADGDTMGLPWKNGSISTARWTGAPLHTVLRSVGFDYVDVEAKGYRFITLYGIEDYHISIPLAKGMARDGDVILAYQMNGEALPRDHGFPLRVVVPGYVGARSVKWLGRIVLTREEVTGMHQRGIAYKQLAPNQKELSEVPKSVIAEMPPVDSVPVTSAITAPEPGATLSRGSPLTVTGYAYSGIGLAVIRVDISLNGGTTWEQATIERADEGQGIRSGKAWAWVQWRYETTVPKDAVSPLHIVCKAIDDQYNQQPHSAAPIWNIRGILNTSWGQVVAHVKDMARL